MYTNKKSMLLRLLAILMIIALVLPIGASAAVSETAQPYSSAYLSSYNAYVYLPGGNEVRVYFNVEGTGYMDEIGALTIELHESTDGSNWSWVTSFTHDSTPGMLSYNDDFHSSYVSYNGVAGRYYKAYVCVWAGKNGSGNSRYFWTLKKP